MDTTVYGKRKSKRDKKAKRKQRVYKKGGSRRAEDENVSRRKYKKIKKN